MKSLIKYLFSVILILLLLSCEKIEEMPQANPKPVVFSFISPQDTLLRVRIIQSASVNRTNDLDNEYPAIQNATVMLSDGETTITLNYDIKEALYLAKANLLPVVAERKYFLSIGIPNGPDITAECQVPPSNMPQIDITDTLEKRSPYRNSKYSQYYPYFYEIAYKWQDVNPNVNCYFINSKVELKAPINFQDSYTKYHPVSFKISVTDDGIFDHWQDDSELMTDIKKTSFSLKGYARTDIDHSDSSGVKKFVSIKKISADFFILDHNFYKYKTSIRKNNEHDFQMFAEPSIVYTNINGGLGIFSGYNKVSVVKEF